MKELNRKIVHILFGVVAMYLISIGFLDIIDMLLLLVLGTVLSLISTKMKIPFISYCLKKFGRSSEKPPGKGAITFVLGIVVLMAVFDDKGIILASIAILTFGDSFGSLVGRRLKKTKYLRKTKNPFFRGKLLEGTLFGIVAGGLAATPFVSISEAFLAATVAMTVEGIELKLHKDPLDDNILIPIVSALTILLFRWALGVW